jgi:hypothetical protein
MQLTFDLWSPSPRQAVMDDVVKALEGRKNCLIAYRTMKQKLMLERLKGEIHGNHH